MPKEVEIYDTTLRDGKQGPDVDIHIEDVRPIVERLDNFGIHYIELGWPGANPKDTEAFEKVRGMNLKCSKIAAFGMTRKKGLTPEEDSNISAIVKSKAEVAAVFGKAWKLHVREVLRATPNQNLDMICDSVSYLKNRSHIKEVLFDAEHFFDGYKDDRLYAMRCLEVAEAAGAGRLVLCDTNGGTLTSELKGITARVIKKAGVPIGIHAHNDSGLAVANSLAAVEAGASQVQGTMNGIGERTGNADLIQVISNLQLKMGMNVVSPENLAKLTQLSKYMYDVTHIEPRPGQPYVSKESFTHKGGIHTHAVEIDPRAYEHVPPESVGNIRRVIGSEVAGRSSFMSKAMQYGLSLNEEEATRVMREVKEKSLLGYQFDMADANLYLIMRKTKGDYKEPFAVVDWEIDSGGKEGESTVSKSHVGVRIEGEQDAEISFGDGPFDALDKAFRKCLKKYYPKIGKVRLIGYKSVPVDISKGSASAVRVSITQSYNGSTWSSQGVSTDSLEASKESMEAGYQYFVSRFYSPKLLFTNP